MHNITLQYHLGFGIEIGGDYTHYTSNNNQRLYANYQDGNQSCFSMVGEMCIRDRFNFLLFTAGRMFNRRKELGIRELHGATSGRLLQLFMVEITLTLLITGVIAAAMLELISMYFAGEWTYYMNFSEGGSWVIKMGGDLAEYLIGVWLLMLVVGYGIIRQVRQATMLRNLDVYKRQTIWGT